MNAQTLTSLAVALLTASVISATAAIIMYRVYNIPAIRRQLTGIAARAGAEWLRSLRPGAWRYTDHAEPEHRVQRGTRREIPQRTTTAAADNAVAMTDDATMLSDVTIPSEDPTLLPSDVTISSQDETWPSRDVTLPSREATVLSEDMTWPSDDITLIRDDATLMNIGGTTRHHGCHTAAAATAATAAVLMMGATASAAVAQYHDRHGEQSTSAAVAVRTFPMTNEQPEQRTDAIPLIQHVTYLGNAAYDLRHDSTVIAYGKNTERTLAVTIAATDIVVTDIRLSGTYRNLADAECTVTAHDYHLEITTSEPAPPPAVASETTVASEPINASAVTSVLVTLSTPGIYDFTQLHMDIDHMGGDDNVGENNIPLGECDGGDALPDPLIIDDGDAQRDTSLHTTHTSDTVTTAEGDDGNPWHNAAPMVSAVITGNPLVPVMLAALQAQPDTASIPIVTAEHHDGKSHVVTIAGLRVTDRGTLTWESPQPTADGTYTYTLVTPQDVPVLHSLFGITDVMSLTFGVDTVAPDIMPMEPLVANTSYHGTPILAVNGTHDLTVCVDDGQHSSGPATLRVDLPALTDLHNTALNGSMPVTHTIPVNQTTGCGIITLEHEGYLDTADIRIAVSDIVGNTTTATVRDLHHADDADAIVIMPDGPPHVAAVTLTDQAPEYRQQRRPGHYRGDVSATFTIDDRWFPLARNHAGTAKIDLLDNSLMMRNGARISLTPLTVRDTGWASGDGRRWTITRPIRIVGKDTVAEGRYHIAFTYQGLHSMAATSTVPDNMLADDGYFVIDWTAPRLGELTISGASVDWRGLSIGGERTISLNGIADDISGVDSSSVTFGTADQHGNPLNETRLTIDPHTSGVTLDDDNLVYDVEHGVVRFDLHGDGFRLITDGTALTIADNAGNYATTGDFSNVPVFRSRDTDMLVVDTELAAISVTYDNNEVRNESYYRAHRRGTLTLTDTNLDLIREREPAGMILTATVDGDTCHAITLNDLQPTDRNGTYVTTFSINRDGDWNVDAAFAEPSPAGIDAAYHETFTIDTVPPKLDIRFDDVDAKHGIFFDAPRTAVIIQTERNMSAAESTVAITAVDGEGTSHEAPVPGTWTQTGKSDADPQWTTNVTFAEELHYMMDITATDLAGNVAHPRSVGEFVIDTTEPVIDMTQVMHGVAYAGTIAPGISVSDTNLDGEHTAYMLEGVRRGPLEGRSMPASTINGTAHEMTVTFRDFPRNPNTDDIYTLTMEASDLAGNTTTRTVTFSVNRFGSTYLFAADTRNIRDTYLTQASDITVHEINVSGLVPELTQIMVAYNDMAHLLAPDEYMMSTGVSSGWSETIYTIPAAQFQNDGFYRIQTQSVDQAGNLSQNTMDGKDEHRQYSAEVDFAIDATVPTVAMRGVENGGVYYGRPGRSFGIDAKDNLGVRRTEVIVNGELVAQWDGDISLTHIPRYTVPASEHTYTIAVRVTDMAGNRSAIRYNDIAVVSDWWKTITPWAHHLTAVLAVLIPAVAVAVVLVTRHQPGMMTGRRHMVCRLGSVWIAKRRIRRKDRNGENGESSPSP